MVDITNLKLSSKVLTDLYCQELFAGAGITKILLNFLPATFLAAYCYYSMFAGCTSLTTAPLLPATNWSYNYTTINWLTSVKNDSSCIFTCPAALGTQATITRDNSHCTTNWTVINK